MHDPVIAVIGKQKFLFTAEDAKGAEEMGGIAVIADIARNRRNRKIKTDLS